MTDQYDGQNDEFDATNPYNTDDFVMLQALRAVSTVTLVKVVACSNSGTVDKIGTVDVLPLVKLMDAAGKTTSHVKIEKIPYMRNAGGDRGVILDPRAGDIGVAVFADRDVQAVRQAGGEAPPGSRRRFSMADGMYLGTVIGSALKTYIRYHDDGTLIIANEQQSSTYPFEVVVGKNFVQIKQHGMPSMHVTIDGVTNTIIQGQTPVLGNDPYPQY